MVKIVFFGTPEFSVPTLEQLITSTHSVVAVVTQPDKPRGRGHLISESPIKKLARSSAIQVLQPEKINNQDFIERLTSMQIDLGVVAAYGKILPDTVLKIPRLGLINAHASLLPKYRGAAPIHRAILAGESYTGISIIQLTQEMDAGPIFSNEKRKILNDETSEEVERDLAKIGSRLLIKCINDLESGKAKAIEQDTRLVTYAPRLAKNDGLINWSESAHAIHNKVRGLHPWPHAYSFLKSERYVILRTSICNSNSFLDRNRQKTFAPPGQILQARGDQLIVSAGDNSAVNILQIQPEGRRPQRTREFLAGHRISPHSTFHSLPQK